MPQSGGPQQEGMERWVSYEIYSIEGDLIKKKKLSGTVTEGSKGGDEIGFEYSHWDQVFYLNAYHMSRKFSSYRFSFKPRMDLDRGSWD